jgi:hypothetical protein
MPFTTGDNLPQVVLNLGNQVEKIKTYFAAHKLMLNVNKTQFMIMCKKSLNTTHEDLSMTVNGESIPQVNKAKYLGVTLDKNLTFEPHVRDILRKMAAGIKTIYTIRDYVPQKTRNSLLQSLVMSHFYYSACLLTSISVSLMNSIDRQLNWGLKACYYKSKFSSSTDLKLKSRIVPINEQIKVRTALYIFLEIEKRSMSCVQKFKIPKL